MERDGDVRIVVRRFYEALGRGDGATIRALVSRSDDALVIGTDPDEWYTGHEAIVEILQTQMEEMGGGFLLVPGDSLVFREGNVAWAADCPVLQLPGGEVPLRITAVLTLEGGDWRIIQWHASIGTRNDEALGRELTT